MPEMTVDFEVQCSTCGAGLCGQSTCEVSSGYGGGTPMVSVEACSSCMEKEHARGYNEGYEARTSEEE